MRTAIFICILYLCLPALSGQSAEEEVIRLKQQTNVEVEETNLEMEETPVLGKEKSGYWNFTVGTSFAYMKGYGSGMSLYAAPTFTLPLSDKWSVHGGLVAAQYQGFNGTHSGETLLPNSFSSFALFVAASYRMSDRLILHGSGVKQMLSAPATPLTPYPIDDLSFGATYRLGDNMTIGATIHLNNGGAYYGSPMNGYMNRSPFGW